ncbi:MAG: nitrogenase molybdenum-iron protein, alpha and beta chain [Clostridiales Family XIII bacterium]|jgi:nitrogenase molybdenum-iron protein beta chain|nr:nitrogenase molybdenum-iron protein, alpha and beta chain [Clostridiales Family XIII bacterium]
MNATCSEQHRTACGVGGLFTALAIERCLPIMHCGPGCFGNVSATLGSMNGGQSGETYLGSVIPSTNFCEDDVVFGGTERLRKLIGECEKYYDADMFFIVDGCTAEIVGDDIGEAASEWAGSEKPVLYASLPGFKGNNVRGHEQVLSAIAEQYLKPARGTDPKQVNIFGVVPFFDPMWAGSLDALEELLTRMGLKPNIIYGRERGVANVDKIPAAGFNLVIAPWTDLSLAERLKEMFGTPYLHFDNLPIGPTETARFIRSVVDYADLDRGVAEDYIKREEDRFYYYMRRSYPWIFSCKNFPRKFIVNAASAAAVSVVRFAVNDLGLIPSRVYITDGTPKEHEDMISEQLRRVDYDEDFDVIFTEDGGLFEESIKNEDFSIRKICVFGSAWDLVPAKKYKLTFVSVAAPYGDRMVGSRTYFGYEGALRFCEDLYANAADNIVDPGI